MVVIDVDIMLLNKFDLTWLVIFSLFLHSTSGTRWNMRFPNTPLTLTKTPGRAASMWSKLVLLRISQMRNNLWRHQPSSITRPITGKLPTKLSKLIMLSKYYLYIIWQHEMRLYMKGCDLHTWVVCFYFHPRGRVWGTITSDRSPIMQWASHTMI